MLPVRHFRISASANDQSPDQQADGKANDQSGEFSWQQVHIVRVKFRRIFSCADESETFSLLALSVTH